MQIKRSGTILRLLSLCTLFVFAVTSVSWSTPAALFQEIPSHAVVPDISTLTIPSELASVQEIFQGEAGKPTIVLIQDAHCVFDAQKHIAGLIDLFQKQHGLNLVALEGGAGKLDPVIFRAFPDREAKESVFNEYLKRGEISGAEWASILNEKPGAFWGVEDEKLYRLNKDAFVRTQRERANLLHELARVKKLLDEFKRELYSNDLKELDTLVSGFKQNHAEIEPLLAFLGKFEPHTVYPTITKLLAISEVDLKVQKEKVLAELAAEDLFSEIEKYISSVRDKLSPSEDVRQLINFYDRLELLTDLAGLQMSRPAFEEYRLDRASYMPEKFQEFAERHGKFIDLAWNLDAHEEFYAIALKRDEVMYENVRNLLAKEGERFALFIAGGFHSSGISHKLKKEGISYIILTPRIDFMPEETTYDNVMNGEVSYKRFLNRQNDTLAPDLVVFSDSAFTKGAGIKLANGIDSERLTQTFQLWHDQIIRMGHDTRFIKGLFDLVRKNAAGELSDAELHESIEKLLLKHTRPYLNQLKQNILSELDQFMNGVRIDKNQSVSATTATEKPVLFPNIDPKLALDSLVNASNRTRLTNYFENWDSVVRGGKEFSDIPRASIFEGVRVAENAIREMDPRLSSAGVRAVAGDLLEHLESRNVTSDVFESWQASGSDISGFGAISLLKNRYVRNAVLVGTLIVGIFAAGVWKASKLEAASIHTISLSQYQVILQKPNENPRAYSLVPGPMYTEQFIKGVLTKVPTGWLVSQGKEINPFNKNSKSLAIQKAAFVIDKKGKIYIGKALDTYQETLAAISKTWKLKTELTIDDVEYAFQAGPMAMEDGKINDKLLDWLNSWAGRKVLIGIKENGDLMTQEVFGLDPFGSDGPSGARVIRILEKMKREGVTHVIFGDGGSTFSGDPGYFGKSPVFELGAIQKGSATQARPGGFGAARAKKGVFQLPRFSNRKFVAFELLEALSLTGNPALKTDFEVLGRQSGAKGSTAIRIRIDRPDSGAKNLARGTEVFYRELAPTRLFDLLYNKENHLVAVFPIIFPREEGESLPKYFDFSPYYFDIPKLDDKDALRKWQRFSARYKEDQKLIERYKTERHLDVEKAYEGSAPFTYVEFYETNPQGSFTPFSPENFDRDLAKKIIRGHGKDQLIFPVFPTVYPPGSQRNRNIDVDYHGTIYRGDKFSLSVGQNVLVVGPGSGIDTWLVWLKTRKRVYALGINPLEVANVKATARLAGFPVMARQHDNLITENGKQVFRIKFDRVLWNMPRFVNGSLSIVFEDVERVEQAKRSLRTLWDGDMNGATLQRFAVGLPKALAADGESLVWNAYETINGGNPVIERFQRLGFNVNVLAFDEKWKVGVYRLVRKQAGFGAEIPQSSRAASVMARLKQHLESASLEWDSGRYGKVSAKIEEKKSGQRPSGKKVFAVSLQDEFVSSLPDKSGDELTILKERQPRDSFYPPMGSLGQLVLYTTLIAGRPAIVILETQPSDGFRNLANRRIRGALNKWSAEAVRAIGEWGEKNNVLVFAISDQIMGSLYPKLKEGNDIKNYYRRPYLAANAGLWKEEKRLLSAGKHKIIQNGLWFAWAGNDYSHFDIENKTHWLDLLFGPDSYASNELADLEILGPDRDIYENAFHALAMSLTVDDLPDLISRSIQSRPMSSGFASFISALIKNMDAVSGFKIIEEQLRAVGKEAPQSLSAKDKRIVRHTVRLLDTFYSSDIGEDVFLGLRETFKVFRRNLDDESKGWFDDVADMIRTRLRSLGFGAAADQPLLPEDFGKKPPYDEPYQIGGKMERFIEGIGRVEVRDIETETIPFKALKRFAIGNTLAFRIVPLGGGEKEISPFAEVPRGQKAVAAPGAGYLLQIWLNGKWIDLDDVDLQDGIPITIKRGIMPKDLNPLLEKDLDGIEKFGPALEDKEIKGDRYDRLAIFWMEGGLQKTVYLPRWTYRGTISRGVERTDKRPGYDVSTKKYLDNYPQTGHVDIEIMGNAVRFSDLGSSNGTQIEVNKHWLGQKAGLAGGSFLMDQFEEERTWGDDSSASSIDLTNLAVLIEIKPKRMREFPYQTPFSVAAIVRQQEKAKVDVKVERGRVLYVKEQFESRWRPAPDNDYVARQYLPVAGQQSLSEIEPSQVTGGYRIKYDQASKKISIFNLSASRLRVAFEAGPGESMGPAGFGAGRSPGPHSINTHSSRINILGIDLLSKSILAEPAKHLRLVSKGKDAFQSFSGFAGSPPTLSYDVLHLKVGNYQYYYALGVSEIHGSRGPGTGKRVVNTWIVLDENGKWISLEERKDSTLPAEYVTDGRLYEQLADFTYTWREVGRVDLKFLEGFVAELPDPLAGFGAEEKLKGPEAVREALAYLNEKIGGFEYQKMGLADLPESNKIIAMADDLDEKIFVLEEIAEEIRALSEKKNYRIAYGVLEVAYREEEGVKRIGRQYQLYEQLERIAASPNNQIIAPPPDTDMEKRENSASDSFGFGVTVLNEGSVLVESAKKFREGFVILRDGDFIQRGEPIYLLGEGAPEAAKPETEYSVPRSHGMTFEDFNRLKGFKFEDFRIHKIYIRFSSPEEWAEKKEVLKFIMDSARFTGRIFIEIENFDPTLMENMYLTLETLKQNNTKISLAKPMHDGIHGFFINVERDAGSATQEIIATLNLLSHPYGLIKPDDSVSIISNNAEYLDSTVQIKDGILQIRSGIGVKDFAESDLIRQISADMVTRKILVRFTREEWRQYRNRVFDKLPLSNENFYGSVIVEVEDFSAADLFDIKKRLQPLKSRMVIQTRSVNGFLPEEFNGFLIEVSKKPIVKTAAQLKEKVEPKQTLVKTDAQVQLSDAGFGAVRTADYITGEQLFNALEQKFEIRSILRGGPIRQPDFFSAIRRDEARIRSMKRRYKKTFKDRSYRQEFAWPADVMEFSELAEAIVSGQVKTPLVFKPNGGAVGQGIIFISRDAHGRLTLTMSYLEGMFMPQSSERVEQYVSSLDLPLILDNKKGIMQIHLDPKKDHVSKILFNIWSLVSEGDDGIYDSGMVESLIPAVRYNGKAYETRLVFEGNLETGESVPVIDETGMSEGSWYGKIGGSSYFANAQGRENADWLPFKRMFNPLFQAFKIEGKKRREFQQYAERIIREEFAFLSKRLNDMGISANYYVRGYFDLVWLPPKDGSNGFPVPVLIEATTVAPDQDLRKKKHTLQTAAAGFGFENMPMEGFDVLALGNYSNVGDFVHDIRSRGADAVANELEVRFDNNYRSVVANLAGELAGIIRSDKTFDESALREKLESVLPDIRLSPGEFQSLWVELFILKSRLEFLARPAVRSKTNIPAINIDPFLNSMPDRSIRADAVKDVAKKIFEALPSFEQTAGSAVVVYTWETFPKSTADILAAAEKISKDDRLVLFHKPNDDLSAITDLLKKNNGFAPTPAQTNGLLEIIKNKRMYYDKLNPIEVNKARSLEQGLSVLLKEVLQIQNSTVGGINTKFVLVLNEPGLYENFDGLPGLVREVTFSLAHLDGMRRRADERANIEAGTVGARHAVPLLEREILDRISGFGFVPGTDGRGGQIISFNLAVFLQRVQESYNALIQTSVAA